MDEFYHFTIAFLLPFYRNTVYNTLNFCSFIAVKRLLKEAQELHEPTEEYYTQPLEDNLFEWHFTVRGPPETDFEGGVYHGRIILPSEYPMKPPNIIFLTVSFRFILFSYIFYYKL